MQAIAIRKGFNLMNLERYNELLSCTCGFVIKGRTVDTNEQETWMKRKTLLRRLNDLEKAIFERSISTLYSIEREGFWLLMMN